MERAVNQKHLVASLLEKANKYRDFARWVGDRETVQRILALTEELKQKARAVARPDEDKIRKRAREIWEENNRPAGRDEEFWLQAEREFREAEDLAKETRDNN
jgi:Zn-dependent oligopeptidase